MPQEFILGTLYFLIYIYINDLSVVSQTTFPIMYVDGTNMFIEGKDLQNMEHDINIKTCTMTF